MELIAIRWSLELEFSTPWKFGQGDWLRFRMKRKHMPGARSCFIFRLVLVVSLLSRGSCIVTIRNWTACTTIMVTPHPDGATEELEPGEWMQYTCTGNGRNGYFTVANNKDDNVVTSILVDGQILALVDNLYDSLDGLLVDSKGSKIQTLFINL